MWNNFNDQMKFFTQTRDLLVCHICKDVCGKNYQFERDLFDHVETQDHRKNMFAMLYKYHEQYGRIEFKSFGINQQQLKKEVDENSYIQKVKIMDLSQIKEIVTENNHKKKLEKFLKKCIFEKVSFKEMQPATKKRYLKMMTNYLKFLISKNEDSISGQTIVEFLTKNNSTISCKSLKYLINEAKILIDIQERGQLNILGNSIQKKHYSNEKQQFIIRYLCDLAKTQKYQTLLILFALNKLQINFSELLDITYSNMIQDYIHLKNKMSGKQVTIPFRNCEEFQEFCKLLFFKMKQFHENKFILEGMRKQNFWEYFKETNKFLQSQNQDQKYKEFLDNLTVKEIKWAVISSYDIQQITTILKVSANHIPQSNIDDIKNEQDSPQYPIQKIKNIQANKQKSKTLKKLEKEGNKIINTRVQLLLGQKKINRIYSFGSTFISDDKISDIDGQDQVKLEEDEFNCDDDDEEEDEDEDEDEELSC